MSVRRLSGWEPAEVTTYEYDGDLLVRSVTVREPEWSPDEVVNQLAAVRLEADMGSHGVSMSEATDPAFAGKWLINEHPKVDLVKLEIGRQRARYYKEYPSAKDDEAAHIWYVKGREE